MYGENRVDDVKKFSRALLSNQIAGAAPGLYARLIKNTGRGRSDATPLQVAQYFRHSFNDYFEKLEIEQSEIPAYLNGKKILEYGPGDVPGVALLMYAHGAKSVTCVDRFPLVTKSDINVEILSELVNSLDGEARRRAESSFVKSHFPGSGFKPEAIDYIVKPSGLAGIHKQIDLVYSRAVLGQVNDLNATFSDMHAMLNNGGIAIHKVDLKSQGMHDNNTLDFLAWPQWMWRLMHSQKSVPNRLRINHYRDLIADLSFELKHLEPVNWYEQNIINEVRPFLSAEFKDVSDEDLAWMGFWLVIKKK